MKRHNLTQHKPQDYEHCRQANTNPHLLGKFFSTYKGAIEFCEKESYEPLTADDIFNLDECGIERDPGAISTSASTLLMLYETNALQVSNAFFFFSFLQQIREEAALL